MFDAQASRGNCQPVPAAPAAEPQWQDSIRTLSPAHLYRFQWHLLRLDTGCRRSRFGSPTSDEFLRAYGERVDGGNAVVLGCFIDGHMRGAAELRPLRTGWRGKAELAFSVESAWQGKGIGTALMAAAIEAARERGIEHLYLTCHALNRRMQRIAEGVTGKTGFENCEYFADITVHLEGNAVALVS